MPQARLGSNVSTWVLISSGMLTLMLAIAGWQAYRWRRSPEDMGELLFWLQDAADRLGYPVDESETAAEFSRGFLLYLQNDWVGPKKRIDPAPFFANVPALIDVYEVDRFSFAGVERGVFDQAVNRWQSIRRPLWRLWLQHRWQKVLARVGRSNK